MRDLTKGSTFYAANVLLFRKQESLTREQLAEVIGVSISTIRKIETGCGNSVKHTVASVLGSYFGVSSKDISSEDLTHLTYSDRMKSLLVESFTDDEWVPILKYVAEIRSEAAVEGHYSLRNPKLCYDSSEVVEKNNSLGEDAEQYL